MKKNSMSERHSELPLVSIIINCYNGEEFLKEAIDSIYSQTYLSWEIIFWDNMSTDRSAEIALSYGSKLKYYRSTLFMPLGESRNYAMERASGKYLAFIDCDDVWFSYKIAAQVNFMELNSDYILCYGGVEEILHNGSHFRNVDTIYTSGFILGKLLMQFDIPILTSMINAPLLKMSALMFDPNCVASEEYCLFMQLASQFKIGVINELLAKYRVHPNSLTSQSLERLSMERRYTLNKIAHVNPGLKQQYYKEFKEAYARANYYDARWFMLKGKRIQAFKSLLPASNLNIIYLLLLTLTLFPFKIWQWVHLKFRNRV